MPSLSCAEEHIVLDRINAGLCHIGIVPEIPFGVEKTGALDNGDGAPHARPCPEERMAPVIHHRGDSAPKLRCSLAGHLLGP